RAVIQNVFGSVTSTDKFFALLRHREIQGEVAAEIADLIAAGDEPQVAGAALAVLAQRIAAALDLRQSLESAAPRKIHVASTGAAGDGASTVHANGAIADSAFYLEELRRNEVGAKIRRSAPKAQVVASGNLTSEAFIRASGPGAYIACLRDHAACGKFLAVAV